MNDQTNDDMPRSTLASDLAALAAEPASAKRIELLHRITDAFIEQADQCTQAEQYLFNEVVTALLQKIAGSDRVQASKQLSKVAKLPYVVVERLAHDGDINVAQPIIGHYRDLPERILVDVAKTGSQAHLKVIAGRPTLTPPVTDVVVTRGDSSTMLTLAANRGAQFSEVGMNRLIDKAKRDGTLQEAIVARTDLSLDAIGKLLPIISEELASRLRGAAVQVDEAELEKHLNEWAADRQQNADRTEAYIESIRKGDLRANDTIGELVAGKRLLDAATVLAAVLDIDRFQTFNLLSGGKLHSALLLLRAAELSWQVAESFIKLRLAKAGFDNYETPPERRDYLAIELATAQRVVRFMKVRKAAQAG